MAVCSSNKDDKVSRNVYLLIGQAASRLCLHRRHLELLATSFWPRRRRMVMVLAAVLDFRYLVCDCMSCGPRDRTYR